MIRETSSKLLSVPLSRLKVRDRPLQRQTGAGIPTGDGSQFFFAPLLVIASAGGMMYLTSFKLARASSISSGTRARTV